MDKLYQKHHGLPGIGVTGTQGDGGSNGKSIYIGFINDFFDYEKVEIDGCVKIARRNMSDNGTLTLSAYQQYMTDAYRYASDVLGTTSPTLESYMNYLAKNVSVFYSGAYVTPWMIKELEANPHLRPWLYDKYNIDINNHYITMMSMLTGVPVDLNKPNEFNNMDFIDITKVTVTVDGSVASFVNVYDYVDENNYKLGDRNNVIVDNVHITYEPDDAAMLMNRYGEFTPLGKEFLDSSTFYTMLDGNTKPIDGSILHDYDRPSFVREFVADPSIANNIYTLGTRDAYLDMSSDDFKMVHYNNTPYGENYKYMTILDASAYKKIGIDLDS